MIRGIGHFLVTIALLISQVPALAVFRNQEFAPPTEGASLTYVLLIEVFCTLAFVQTIRLRRTIQSWRPRKFNFSMILMLGLLIGSATAYNIVFTYYVIEDSNHERCIVPFYPKGNLARYIDAKKESGEIECASVSDLKTDNKIQFFVTILFLNLLYLLLCSTTVYCLGAGAIRIQSE